MKKVIVVILCLTMICSLTACALASADNSVTDEAEQKYGDDAVEYAEEVAKEYIRLYQNREFDRIAEITPTGVRAGDDFYLSLKKSGVPLDEIWTEKEAYSGSGRDRAAATYQAVVYSFGEQAWDTVGYEIKREKHWEGTTVFFNTETGQYVSLEDCQRINYEYIMRVSGEENADLNDLLQKYPREYPKWIENVPVKTEVKEDYALYLVKLTFDEKRVPDKIGVGYLQFGVSNKTGKWAIYSGVYGGVDDYSEDFGEMHD